VERRPINPVIQQRLAREEAERIAAEREKEALAGQLNKTPPAQAAAPDNPANVRGVTRFNRTPMNTPRRKLAVKPIPGFRLYWHKQSDVERALDAGYVFVDKGEVQTNSRQIGAAYGLGGNTALGSEISIVGSAGTGERLILMKIPEEWYFDDKRAIFEEHAKSMRAIFDGEVIMMPDGFGLTSVPDSVVGPAGGAAPTGTTYVKKQPYTALFNRGQKAAPQVSGARVRMY
jgi:hypothetical protein